MAAVTVSVAMLVITLCLFAPPGAMGDMGLCLPSPNEWQIPKFLGWCLNSVLVFISVAVISSANRQYNLIPGSDYVLPALLTVLLCSCCITTATISTSTILMATNIAALYILFETYESYNASRQFFVMASILSVGSMFQYAFLMMIPVYILGGVLMKSLRIRETIAFLLGLVAPYWVFIGLGIVPFPSLQMPDTLRVLSTARADRVLGIALIAGSVTAILGVILAVYNSLRLLMRNARPRSMHATISLMGIVCTLCMLLNFNNFVSYLGTLALWLSLEIAMTFSLYEVRGQRFWIGIVSAFCIAVFILFL